MSEISDKKPFLLWSCILHVSILLFLILSVSLSGSSSSSSSPQQNIIHATVVSSQALAQYQNAIIQKQVAKQQAIQKVQDVLKAEQAAQAKAIADAKAAAEKAAESATAAKAAAMKQSIEKQLKASMAKQLASTPPSTKPTAKSSAKPSDKPSPVPGIKSNPGLTDKYKAMIIQAISEQWNVPQNLPKNISCVLNVRVAPGGVVIQVTVAKSSGNSILDNSAIAAVNKASPLPVPTDPNLFDAFRTLKLTVKPDGSMID